MANDEVRTLSCEEDTVALAKEIAKSVRGGMVIGLCGELGAGKTTFTRALVAALGSTDQVSSPTYVLEHQYRADKGIQIEHWDLYRIGQLPDDLLEPPKENSVRVIEWVDRFSEELGPINLLISLAVEDKSLARQAVISYLG
jgi:tRNA threonylcarbamoyladenosine biosynthesis protein TsaE